MKIKQNHLAYLARIERAKVIADWYMKDALEHNEECTILWVEWFLDFGDFREYDKNQLEGFKSCIREHLKGKPYRDTPDGSGLILGQKKALPDDPT